MANIIIPPEHQSAPKEPARILPLNAATLPQVAKDAPPPWETYDAEMDLPEYHDPKMQAAVAELEKRVQEHPPEQHVEEALRQHEINARKVAAYRWKGQERWQGRENEEMRLVHIYHAHTFIEKLRRAGIEASVHDPLEWFREAKIEPTSWPHPQARLWLNSFVKAGRVGVTAINKGEIKTVTTLQWPYSPEFSVMRFDEYNLPTNERYRGWRTTLLALIIAGVLTEDETERAFGPALGPAGEFYREQLYLHRAIRLGVRVQ